MTTYLPPSEIIEGTRVLLSYKIKSTGVIKYCTADVLEKEPVLLVKLDCASMPAPDGERLDVLGWQPIAPFVLPST